LLLWLNEITEIDNIVHSNKLSFNLKIMKTTSAICSFIYYFTDNIVWLAKIGFVNKYIPFSHKLFADPVKWGYVKDQFSLLKTLLELVIYIYIYSLKVQEDA
jgi:hypothetical protein